MASFRTNPVFSGGILQTSSLLGVQSGLVVFDVSWDMSDSAVDLDATAVCFTSTGTVCDAAFYNNLQACHGGIVHSGDVKRNGNSGLGEKITVNLDGIAGVSAVMLMLSAYSGGNFNQCESALIQISHNNTVLEARTASGPDTGSSTGLFLGLLFRHPDTGAWHYKLMACPVAARHFSACLVQMRKIVDCVLDPGSVGERSLSQDATFEMEKGDQRTVPAGVNNLCVGLGWTPVPGKDSIDLDASCIMLEDIDHDGDLDPVDVVYFGQKVKRGVRSSGDNVTGAGEGDDETISVTLNEVPAEVGALAFVVTVYSYTATFADISASYVRLFDPKTNHEFARFKFDNSLRKSGVVFCMLVRDQESHATWRLIAQGQECDGRTARDCKTHLWDGTWDDTSRYGVNSAATAAAPDDGCCTIC